jgi:hypothetical protein
MPGGKDIVMMSKVGLAVFLSLGAKQDERLRNTPYRTYCRYFRMS